MSEEVKEVETVDGKADGEVSAVVEVLVDAWVWANRNLEAAGLRERETRAELRRAEEEVARLRRRLDQMDEEVRGRGLIGMAEDALARSFRSVEG